MYAWLQDVPIGRETYAKIVDRLGEQVPEGLQLHVALEREDGTLRYLDIWDDEASCDRFSEDRLHPAVGPVLAADNIHVTGEPTRVEVGVVHLWGSALKEPTLH
jgi:hypothetical protein